MFEFPKHVNVPLDLWVDAAMDWLLTTFADFFDALGAGILWFMLKIEGFFLWIPWFVLIAIVGGDRVVGHG
jgi:ABC-type proline/glycine betaine transport system permease subunit